ncbi:MAG TPA: lysylphosphatidylglycerol synthase transmembrane domain-containing protein [Vicinamibacterales bacterium]|nr:lysylphosphatidylglycerol synthase transmembrane domain-containing protein [Vicinamibacterales bacterium]
MPPADTAAPASRTRRDALLWVVKITVSAGLLYLLFTRIEMAKVWAHMREASAGWILFSFAIYFVMLMVSTVRWRSLLRTQRVEIPFGTLVNSYLAATFANNFLPSNIGGDVIRIADTARTAKSRTLAAAVVLADRGIGIVGLGFIAACGSSLAARRSEIIGPIGPALFWLGLAAATAAVVLVIARPEHLRTLARPLHLIHAEWVGRRMTTITDALHNFRKAPGVLVGAFLLSIVVQALLVGFYVAVATALRVSVPIGHMAMLVPVSFLVQMLPVSVNGFGVREGTFVAYLAQIGIPKESAVALSLIGAVLIMAFSMLGVAAYLGRKKTPTP